MPIIARLITDNFLPKKTELNIEIVRESKLPTCAQIEPAFIKLHNPKDIQQSEQKVIDYKQAMKRQTELLLQQERIKEEQGELRKHLKK